MPPKIDYRKRIIPEDLLNSGWDATLINDIPRKDTVPSVEPKRREWPVLPPVPTENRRPTKLPKDETKYNPFFEHVKIIHSMWHNYFGKI